MNISAGTRLGRYEIRSQLGAGGMGEVYLAEDMRLRRRIALKILPAEVAANQDRMRRFNQEATAAAALNHSNIAHVYEIDEADGLHFIAMEFIDGETLRQRMRNVPVKLGEVLDVAAQIASALAAAHAAGIVHRDIKPENVMLRRDGVVKVLDFGLAKLTEQPVATSADTEAPTRGLMNTEPGVVMGTAIYMSPEQARGLQVDARTDIFSLGVLIYEMVAGRLPFEGSNTNEILASILSDKEPAPLARYTREVPAELERIVSKALRKDREARYQTVKDLLIDLRDLKLELEFDARLERSIQPDVRAGVSAASVSGQTALETAQAATASTGEGAAVPTISSARILLGEMKRHKLGVSVTLTALLIAAIAAFVFLNRKPVLTDKDTIVLADFTNTTGDSVFDGTLRQGLVVQLEQSPFLSLITEERIQKALRLMGQPADARLTPEVAKEICERTASAALLEGSIASLGSQYVLGLRAKNCRTGEVLDEEQVQAAKKEDVLNALSQIAIKFRTRVGESLPTVKQHDTPLEEATTPSLEALRAYSAASKVLTSANNLATAVPLFKRAIEIDPKFAMAYASLGFTYGLIGEPGLSAESNSKAYQLRDRASDREKFFITATYDLQVTGNLEKALQTCELWVQTYPREITPYGLLGAFLYPTFGKYEKGVEVAKQLVELDPDFPIGYLQLEFNSQFLGDLGEAEKTLHQASDRKLEIPELLVQRYDVAFLKGDKAGMDREVALAQGKSGAEDAIYLREGFVLAYSGELEKAKSMSQRAADLNQQPDQRGRKALIEIGPALWDGFLGNTSAAKRSAAAAADLSQDRDVEYGAGFALALAGESTHSQKLAKDLDTRFPEDSEVQSIYLPSIRALLELNGGGPSKAIELLQRARPYDRGTPPCAAPMFFGNFYTVYVRGLAYLAAHQGPEAAAEFQKIIDGRSIVVSDPIGALAHLQLGRAFALSGDTTKAKTAYQDFLTLWKDADPDIPILIEAKREYEKIK